MSRSLLAAAPRSDLPHYAHPPLVEVLLGVRWAFEGTLDDAAVRALHERLGPAWEPLRPTPPTHSALPQSWTPHTAVFQSVLGEQRLELSADGLEYTWDGRQGDLYPHYETVRDAFVVALDAWHDWLAVTGTPAPTLCGWKVTYLNSLPQGTVWNQLSDPAFFRLLAPVPAGLPPLERCAAQWTFGLDRHEAQLVCDLKTTAGTARDPRTCLWLRLSCQGAADDEEPSLLEGLDYGRAAIVRTFRQLMSPAANTYWELDGTK
jgi:hypothetical protein